MTDEFEPSVQILTEAVLLKPGSEHRKLRDAIDEASVEGTTTWVKNSAGAPVAAIVPRGVAELGLAAWNDELAWNEQQRRKR